MKPRLLLACLAFVCTRSIAAAITVTIAQDGSGDFNGTNEKPILAAVAKVRAAGGGEIGIKRGTYVCAQSIVLKDAKKITFRGEPGAQLKLPPLQYALTKTETAAGATELPIQIEQGLTPGLRLRIMARGAVDSFSGQQKPSFYINLARVDGDRLVLAKPLEFSVPAGTQIMNEDAPNLIEVRGASEDIVFEDLIIDGGRIATDPPIPGHAQLCGIFAQGAYDYVKGPTGPPMQRLVVRDCTIRNCFGRAVAFYSVKDPVVERCTIEDIVDEAIDLDHFVVGARVTENAVARGRIGVELNDANDSEVARNSFTACGTGINLWRWCKQPDLNTRNRIVDNFFTDIKGHGMSFGAGTFANIVRGNRLQKLGGRSIALNGDDYEVSGNTATEGISDKGQRNRVFDNQTP